jgi:hypothetical protein
MSDLSEFEALIAHITRTTRLTRPEAAHLIAEVLAFLDELPEAFVCRRHRALQEEGLANDAIFVRLGVELAERRFRAPVYSARQIRRMIYG